MAGSKCGVVVRGLALGCAVVAALLAAGAGGARTAAPGTIKIGTHGSLTHGAITSKPAGISCKAGGAATQPGCRASLGTTMLIDVLWRKSS